jgi:hypothetical protein
MVNIAQSGKVNDAAIIDIDILKDGGATWGGWLKAANFPGATTGGLGQIRGDLHKRFTDSGKDMKGDGGVNALKTADRNAANELFDTLDQLGVFGTRRGKLKVGFLS